MTGESPYDIELSRVFDAPPERLYRAFTIPDNAIDLRVSLGCGITSA